MKSSTRHLQTIRDEGTADFEITPMKTTTFTPMKAPIKRYSTNCIRLNQMEKEMLHIKRDHITSFNPRLVLAAISSFKNSQYSYEPNNLFINFLFQLEPFNQIISESAGDEAQDIIRNLSFNLKYERAKKDTIIFRFGEYSEKFYLILKGKVSVAVPNDEDIELTEEEYFLYLLKLRQYNEKDILNKVVSNNFTSYFFEEKTFDLWVKTAYNTLVMLKTGNNRNNMINPIPRQRRQSVMKSPSKRRKISTLSSTSIPKRSRRYSVHAQNFMLNKEQERKAVFDSPEQRNLVMRLESDIINTIKVVDPSVCEYNYERSYKKNEKEVTIDEYII